MRNEARTTEAARRWRSARAPDTLSSTRPADPWTRDGRNKPAQRVTTPRRDLVDARSQLRANDKHSGWPNALARFRTPVGKKGFTPPIPWRPPSRPRPKGHPRRLPRPRWPQDSRPAPSGPHALRLSRRQDRGAASGRTAPPRPPYAPPLVCWRSLGSESPDAPEGRVGAAIRVRLREGPRFGKRWPAPRERPTPQLCPPGNIARLRCRCALVLVL